MDKRLYFPSEDDFFALKIRRLRLSVNPRTWVPKASTLPLDHRSRLDKRTVYTLKAEALDRTLWRTCFGRDSGLKVRQATTWLSYAPVSTEFRILGQLAVCVSPAS